MRAVLRRLLTLCLAALVLSGALGAGRTYLWCSMMQASVETCCCPLEPPGREAQGHQPSEFRNGCCQHRGHDEIDEGRLVSGALEVPPAVLATTVSPSPALRVAIPIASRAPASSSCAQRASPIRAGPRAASEICARLQVFRC